MSVAWRNLRWCIAYWISRLASRVGRYLPTRFCYTLADPIADVCFFLLLLQRRNLVANLTRVVGEAEAPAAARRVFRNFAKYVIDFYQLPVLGRDVLRKRIKFDAWQTLDEALDQGTNGTIFVTLHLGQAELGGAALSTYHHPVNVIAEALPYAPMNDLIQELRRSLGMRIIPAKKANREVLRCLARGEVMAIMLDGVQEDGVAVELFGAPALVSSAPARIALRTGARVLPAVLSRDRQDETLIVPTIDFDFRFQTTGDEETDVLALTQALAHSFERYIRLYGDQWFSFRPFWTAQTHVETAKAAELWKQWALSLAAKLGGRLPRGASYGLARLGGDLAYYARTSTRRDVADNMRHVLGANAAPEEISRQTKEAFRSVARYYVDLIRLPQTNPDTLLSETVRLHDFNRLEEPLKAGKGVIVATAHFGNPEMAIQIGAILGLNVLVLAEPLQPPSLARLMEKIRCAYGARYENVGFNAIANAIRHLKAGGCLAVTCDRDIQGRGEPVPFFGVPAKLPLGAVELAVRTGALLIPGYCKRSGDGFDIYFEEPLDLCASGNAKEDALVNARALVQRVERWIRADPGQWMTLERIWKLPATEKEPQRPFAII